MGLTESRLGDSGLVCRDNSVGEIGLPPPSLSSMVCDENDGPNADSSASADGNCWGLALPPLRGERGSLLNDRGVFVSDSDDASGPPETCEDDADAPPGLTAAFEAPALLSSPRCHSLDLAVLIPRRPLDPKP